MYFAGAVIQGSHPPLPGYLPRIDLRGLLSLLAMAKFSWLA